MTAIWWGLSIVQLHLTVLAAGSMAVAVLCELVSLWIMT